MTLQFSIQTNEKLAIRSPESTVLGQKIVRQGLLLMHQLGYEQFTFRKLAEEIHTTEAGVYRYFENKHKFLLYLLSWYWNYLEFSVVVALQNISDPHRQAEKIIHLICSIPSADWPDTAGLDRTALYQVAIAEGRKSYLTKEVDDINKDQLFKPYKDLCGRIASVFSACNPGYPYPRALASTVLEVAHFQPYFQQHLPSLTDIKGIETAHSMVHFLQDMVFASLGRQ